MVPVALTVALASTVTMVWLLGSSGKPVSAESASQVPTAPTPVVPAAGTAYLGAFVDPAGTALSSSDPTGGTSSLPAELSSLSAFNAQVGSAPSVLSTFQDWSEPVDVAELDRVAATGAIPMVTWDCGDTDADVAAGLDDAAVTAEARALAATDVPVLLRWFPDPNLTTLPATASCLGTEGASGFVAAYRHIHSLFEAAGATNVAFVWSVATSAGANPNLTSYYPGASVVDWIAADGSATVSARPQPAVYSPGFESWYSAFSPAGKPMMISSAGADTGSQTAYFGQIASALPARYPAIRAFVYFDAPDVVSNDQYQLDSVGSASLRVLATSAYFRPNRAPTVTTVSSSESAVPSGTAITLTASVDSNDNSGSVSFLDDGAVIKGCLFIPITTAPSCQTSQLGLGAQNIVAVYGGDAAFSPSTSAPVTVTVSAATPPVGGTPAQAGSTTTTSAPGPGAAPTAGSSAQAPSSSAGGSAGGQQDHPQAPQVPVAGQAYLGAFVDPTGQGMTVANPTGGTYSLPVEVAAAPSFDAGLSRPLSITSISLNWSNQVLITQIDQVWALGAVPMITWNCGDSDWNVASGKDDSLISAVAQKLAATHIPIFLRWYPDPNDQPSASARSCLLNVPAGLDPATEYRAAFQHIHDLFAAAGASNVAFVWSVDATQGQGPAGWDSYYPGNAFVDWIGADGFYSRSTGVRDPFSAAFQQWYEEYSGSGKPLIISSLGAVRGTQGQYLQDVADDLPTLFPEIKGLVYFDAPDRLSGVQYELNSDGTSSFDDLSQLATFQLSRQPSTLSLTATPSAVGQSAVVKITAWLAPSDLGGNLDFFDNGTTIAGCGAVPVLNAGGCETSALSSGQNSITATYEGDAQYAPAVSSPVYVSVSPGTGSAGPPTIPGQGTAYLGAYVRPYPLRGSTYSTTSLGQELHLLPGFNSSLDRPLSVVHIYQPWTQPTPDAQIQEVRATGAIPMIDWECGDTDANIIAGADDALITGFAQQLAALKAPIFLRWYYEPNFPGGANYANCISNLGPQGYVEAYRHIHDLFEAAGATNVAFVWNIGASGTDHDWIDYYPGAAYVDWITADGYVRTSIPTPGVFSLRFAQWYQTFADFGKPLMITETAAFSGAQQSFLSQIQSEVATEFPLLKGILYFDAFGNLAEYPLDAEGMQSFRSLSWDPFFQPNRTATSTTVETSPNLAVTGQAVTMTANVQATDNGGSVSFYDKGQPVTGCQSVPLDVSSSCTSTDLPTGANAITAVYSGDADNAGSNGTAPSATVMPLAFPDVSGFAGTPDLAPVPALSFGPPAGGGSADPDPSRLASAGAQGTGSDPLAFFAGAFRGEYGFGADAVLIGAGLLAICGLYIASTWIQDQRRRRTKALGTTMAGETTHVHADSGKAPSDH